VLLFAVNNLSLPMLSSHGIGLSGFEIVSDSSVGLGHPSVVTASVDYTVMVTVRRPRRSVDTVNGQIFCCVDHNKMLTKQKVFILSSSAINFEIAVKTEDHHPSSSINHPSPTSIPIYPSNNNHLHRRHLSAQSLSLI
jgi:hypothetical protein